MTTQATEYTFVAGINSKGRQGRNWKIEFDWKLPGSKFPFVLYGREDTDIEGWDVGDTPQVTVAQGHLKSGKNGQYASDYFYDLVSMEAHWLEVPDSPAPGQVVGTRSRDSEEPEAQWSAPPVDDIQSRIEKGMAFNAAVALLAQKHPVVLKVDTLVASLRQLRDTLLHHVIEVPVAPVHFCYEHETQRVQSPKTGAWGHVLPNGKGCVDTRADATAPATDRAEEGATEPAEGP